MWSLIPIKTEESCFGNKYKQYLACLATGLPTYANVTEGFDKLLEQEAFAKEIKGYPVYTWRLPVPRQFEYLLDDSFDDSFGERYGTQSPEFSAIYGITRIIDFKYQKIPQQIRDWYLRGQEWIPWSKRMKEEFEKIPRHTKMLGVSVRTWKAPHDCGELNDRRVKEFSIQPYIDRVKELEESGLVDCMFLSVDNDEAYKYFEHCKLPRVTIEKPNDFTVLQWAALKAMALGQARYMIGNKESSFIEVAWWMGGCKAGVFLLG